MFDYDILNLNTTHVDMDTFLQLLARELNSVSRNVEAILIADAARQNGEISQLDVKSSTIEVCDGEYQG